jgi:cell division protease FtsH
VSQRLKGLRPGMRPPKPFFERVKIPFLLVAYITLQEWASPLPFYVTTSARVAAIVVVLFVIREFHHARLEVDPDWAGRTVEANARVKSWTDTVSKQTWLKLQRLLVWLVSLYAFGMLLNAMTARCSSPTQCVVLAPRMAVENLPQFIQFAIMMTFALAQLAVMFWAMVKVGSYKVVMPGTVKTTFDDVWGQDEAKQKVMEQVALLESSDAIEAAGGYMPKGLLLYGPPGTGKTYLAKASANYSSKPLILVPPGAFQATFVGINLLKVWALFREIRKLARRYGGVIVFIDEIDSLGSRGGSVSEAAPPPQAHGCVRHLEPKPRPIVVDGAGGGMGTLEAFLSAMDGMEEPRGFLNRLIVFAGFRPLKPYDYKYLMMAATNMPERLDPALLRAGRFGRKIHVSYPKASGRLKTYEGYLGKVSHDLTGDQIGWAARNHTRGTGAEIQDIVNEAVLVTFRDERETPGVVHFDDLVHAMVWVGFGEGEGPFEREQARWLVAVHEAGHAVAFHHLCAERQRIWFASIERRGDTGGMVVPTPLDEDWLETRSEMLADIQVGLASRVAEQLFFGETTNGNAGDGQQATETAQKMVRVGQAGDQIGMYDRDDRRRTERILGEALEACTALLSEHRDDVEAVAKLLCEKGTVSGDQIHALLGGDRET